MGYGFDDDSSAGGSSRGSSRSSRSNQSNRSSSSRSKTRKLKIFSSKRLPNNGNPRPSNLNDKNKQEAMQRQAQLYAELAKELEQKLKKRNAEIMALRRSNQVLQKQSVAQKSQISSLESQCVARSAKVAQLSDSIATRKNGKVQERLVEKSLEIADLVEENERLKIQKKTLQDDKSRNDKLLLEMCEIVRILNQVDIPYDKAGNEGEEGCYSNMIFPKGRYSLDSVFELPQNIPIENVRRKIQAIEGVIRDKEELRKENELQKHKLQVLREKNADLSVEISSLEEKLKDQKRHPQGWVHANQRRTMSEASSRTWGNDSGRSCATFSTSSFSEDGTREVSLRDFVAQNGRTFSEDPSEDTGIRDSVAESYGGSDKRDFLFTAVSKSLSTVDELNGDSDSDESDNTSFSSLESPPSKDEEERSRKSPVKETPVRLEEHKQLQNNFEKALDVIEKLKDDLNRATNIDKQDNSYKRDFEKASREVERLEHELEETVSQYTMLKGEHKALCDRHEEELEAAKRMRTELESNHKHKLAKIDQASETEINDLRKQNKQLQKQYSDLETEYTLKIESLELKIKELKHQLKLRRDDSTSKCEDLEDELKKLQKKMDKLREEYDAIDSVHQQRVDSLLEECDKNSAEHKKKFDDLRYEYDTFLEIHLKLEEDAEQAKQYYKDSLLKVRTLEAEAKVNAEDAEKTKTDHQSAIEASESAHQEAIEKSKLLHQEEVKKLHATIGEWKVKLMNLKRNHVAAIKAHNEATQKSIAEIKQIKKDHGIVMAKQGRMRQNDAAKYQKLRREYDMSLVDYGKREQITIHKFEQSKRQYESKILNFQKKLQEYEKILPFTKKNALMEKFDNIESESKKKIDQLQLELVETSKRLEAEANEQLTKAQTRLNEKLQRLMETNQKLNEHSTKCEGELEKSRRCQEQVMLDYQELVASYQAALLKIESLVKLREDNSIHETKNSIDENRGITTYSGSEQEASTPNSQNDMPERSLPNEGTLEKSNNSEEKDSGFQKDFDMIMSKLGADSSNEESSVVSSAGSSVAGSAIFDAIYKRVEEHAQKLEFTKTAGPTENFEAARIFDIIHHFIRLSKVHSHFRKLSRFRTLNEENEEIEVNEIEIGKPSETISNLLLHRKRFQSVQSTLLRQVGMTQLEELQPSTLIGLFPSEYGNTSNEHKEEESVEETRLHGESFSKQLHFSAEEIRMKTREKEMRLMNLKYQNLREEFQEIKSGKSNLPPSNIAVPLEIDDASSHAQSIGMASVTTPVVQETKQIESFQKKVLQAELKAALSKREWEQHKTKLDLVRFEHEVTMKALLNDTEGLEEPDDQIVLEDEALLPENLGTVPIKQENLSWEAEAADVNDELGTFDIENPIELTGEGKTSNEESTLSTTYSSDDAEDTTSNSESQPNSNASLDAQDGKPVSSGEITNGTKETASETDFTTEGEDGVEDDDSGDSNNVEFEDQSNDEASDSENSAEENPKKGIGIIQRELEEARKAAEAARRKQMEREQNLRDVIFHYKKLKKQHEEAQAEKSKSSVWRKNKGDSTGALEEDLKQAHENVNMMQRELKEACDQHTEEKQHLRDVMSQFQNLQADYLKILAEKEELEKAVYQNSVAGVVPASISIGPHPRFLDPSGSWVESTIGGVSFETDSTRTRNYRPAPDGSPLRKVTGPPQRSNNEVVSSCKIVELCDADRVFRPQVHTNPALTPTKPTQTVQPSHHSDHTNRTSSATTHSTMKGEGQHRQLPQHLTEKQLQQQRHVLKLRELGEKHMHPEQSEIKISKKKKGIFRGWRKQ